MTSSPTAYRPRGRRAMMIAAGVAIAIALGWFAVRILTARGASPSPRTRTDVIVLITLDTLRPDRISCYGSKSVATPNIDGFAATGVRFTNAASSVPLTLPAHASIMTGLYPPGHGLRDNVGYVLDERIPTLAELLRKGGWATAGFVSAFVLDRRWGIGRGFEEYFDDFDPRGMADATSADMAAVQRDGAETVAAAVKWLDKRPAGRPFFLWLHLYDPHDPYTPKEPYRSRYPGRPYDAEVAYTDAVVGDFRRALEQRGLLDRALVVITSDHGEGLGEHGEKLHGFFVYDSTIKAALIIRPPSGESAGRVVDESVSHVDLLPTILDFAGLQAPANIHGRSLAPLISGRKVPWDRPVYSESLYPLLHYGWAPLRAIRDGRLKLIDAPRPELYDLEHDREEEKNIHDGSRREARKLATALSDLRHLIDKRDRPAEKRAALDEETAAKLRSLGYLAGQSGAGEDKENERRRVDPKDRIQVHEMTMAAQSLLGEHETAGAKQLAERVLAADESVADAHQLLGEVAAAEQRPGEAITHFRRALALNPEHERALFGLAAAYAQSGRYDDALAGYRRILEIRNSDVRASLAIADIYLALGRFEDAATALDRAAAKGKQSAFFANRKGEVRAEQGRDDEAAKLFERAFTIDPGFALPHFNLAVIHEKRGNAQAAIEQYDRALQIEPDFCRAQFNLGRLHASTGDRDTARQLWEASLRSCPGFVQGHYYLAKLLMDGGDLARAEKLARDGIALDPQGREGPLGYYVLGDVLNRTGRSAEGRKAMEKGRAIQASAN